jgi:hypothetical protein
MQIVLLPSEMLLHSRGRYTPQQIERVTTMSGAFGYTVHNQIATSIGLYPEVHRSNHTDPYGDDISKFLAAVKDEELYIYKGSRHHHGFENFVAMQKTTSILDKGKVAKKLKTLNKDLDFWRKQILRNARQNP